MMIQVRNGEATVLSTKARKQFRYMILCYQVKQHTRRSRAIVVSLWGQQYPKPVAVKESYERKSYDAHVDNVRHDDEKR